MKKIFVVGIIFLFIGIAVAPSINSTVVKTSDDLIEVTSQACGIQGFGNTTVKLTKEQYQNLEQYLVDFRARLNQTTTKEEAIPIFKDAVVELNKYGLLPKGMSVERAQRLVTGKDENRNFPSSINFPKNNQYIINKNILCFLAGVATNSLIISPALLLGFTPLIGMTILEYILDNKLYNYPALSSLLKVLIEILALGTIGLILLLFFLPIVLTSIITFGTAIFDSLHQEERTYPSKGWVFTLGLLGIKWWRDSFLGQFGYFGATGGPLVGALGFTGIKIVYVYPYHGFFNMTTNSILLGYTAVISLD